jgi:hypothetical protein
MIKLIETKILNEVIEEYWDDSSRHIKGSILLNVYVKDKYRIEVNEYLGVFLDRLDIKIRYKTIIKIFEGTSLVKRKLWWLSSKRIEDMNNEELIEETFKLIPDLAATE